MDQREAHLGETWKMKPGQWRAGQLVTLRQPPNGWKGFMCTAENGEELHLFSVWPVAEFVSAAPPSAPSQAPALPVEWPEPAVGQTWEYQLYSSPDVFTIIARHEGDDGWSISTGEWYGDAAWTEPHYRAKLRFVSHAAPAEQPKPAPGMCSNNTIYFSPCKHDGPCPYRYWKADSMSIIVDRQAQPKPALTPVAATCGVCGALKPLSMLWRDHICLAPPPVAAPSKGEALGAPSPKCAACLSWPCRCYPQPPPRVRPAGMSALDISAIVTAASKGFDILARDYHRRDGYKRNTAVANAPEARSAVDNAGDMLDLLEDVR